MAVQVLRDEENELQCMFCNTTDWAFGMVVSLEYDLEDFIEWLYTDPRKLSDSELTKKYYEWLGDMEEEEIRNNKKWEGYTG